MSRRSTSRRGVDSLVVQSFTPKSVAGLALWLRSDLGITFVMGPVVATGTAPPAVTLTGTPVTASSIEIDITLTGILGTATFQWKLAGVVQQTGQLTAATFALGTTGLTANFPVGAYVNDNVFVSSPQVSAWADQSGLGNNFSQGTASRQPIFNANGFGTNSRPFLSTVAASGMGLACVNNSSAYLTGAGAERFVVKQELADPPVTGDGSTEAKFGSGAQTGFISFTNGIITDGFATTVANGFARVINVANPFIYGSCGQAADWRAFGNGTQIFSTGANTFGANAGPAVVCGNAGGSSSNGKFCEWVVYNRVLLTAERTAVNRYLGSLYGIAVP